MFCAERLNSRRRKKSRRCYQLEKNTALGTEPIGRLIVKLSLPTVAAQLVNLLYNIVDRIYVGRIPGVGSLALAGLGVTFPIIMLVSAFAQLAGMGAPRASIAMGAGDYKKAEKYLGNSTLLLIIFSVILSVVFFITKDPILMIFGASENTLPYASDYISVYLIGTIFVQITLGLNMFITNQGFSKTSMLTVCLGAVLNIVLDPLFIFVFDMGVKGAALATIISQCASCVWVLLFLTGKRTILKLRLKALIPDMKMIGSILALGISPFVMQATECLIQLTFNKGMITYGNDMYVAVMSVLFSIMQLVWMPLSGFSQGVQPIIGYNYGAGKIGRVKKAFRAPVHGEPYILARDRRARRAVPRLLPRTVLERYGAYHDRKQRAQTVHGGYVPHGCAKRMPADVHRPRRSEDLDVPRLPA